MGVPLRCVTGVSLGCDGSAAWVCDRYVRLGRGGYRSAEEFAADGAALVAGARRLFRRDPHALADVAQWESLFKTSIAKLMPAQESPAPPRDGNASAKLVTQRAEFACKRSKWGVL